MRKRLRLLLFTATVLTALLGLVECGLRTVAPLHLTGIQTAYRYDEDAGYVLRSGVDLRQSTDHLQEIHTNALGTVNYEETFDGYDQLVFAVGDSFTQGTGLSPDASYPFQLGLTLNRGPDGAYSKRYGIVNLGVAATGTDQALILLKRYMEQIGKPDIVLFFGCENDAEDDTLFRSGYRHGHLVEGNPKYGLLTPVLITLNRLEIVKRLKIVVSSIRRGGVAPGTQTGTKGGVSVAERTWPGIEAIIATAHEAGAEVVVSWTHGESESYGWLQAKATEAGVSFADWYPAVASMTARTPSLPAANPHSGQHWRPWVNRIIADAFADQIRAPR